MEELGEDMVREILSRAAVKDLVRWKSVCKRWLRIISSRSFISLHHRRSSFTAVHATSVYGVVSQGIFAQLAGTCDGLLCLRNHAKGLICVWNPSLHAHHCLSLHIPKPPHDGLEHCYWFGRGGGDDEDDGYKLIIGTASHLHLVALYDGDGGRVSLKRELEKSYNFHETIGTRFQNSVCWPAAVGEDDDTWVIVSFDLGKETIGELPAAPPPNMKPARLSLGQVHGCLSALMLVVDLSYQLWVMTQQQQHADSCWTKLADFRPGFCLPLELHQPSDDDDDGHHDPHPNTLVNLEHPALINSPIYGKRFYVQTLVSPAPTERQRER